MPARLFMSYSHKDEALRDQLETHLAMLKRQGVVEVWHDRKILAGDHLDGSIRQELERADVILLLLSPDFLASDYCFGIEMQRAMERHREGAARVIGVILRHCDWTHTELREFLATPTDGKPVTKWADSDEAFLNVAQSIRAAIADLGLATQSAPQLTASVSTSAGTPVSALPRSSNLALRRTFSQAEQDDFLLDSFDYISRFFQGSLTELQQRNPGLTTRHRSIDANSFTAAIYLNGDKRAACTIRIGGPFGGMTYSNGEDAARNGWNENLSVEVDDQKIFLRAAGMPHFGQPRGSKLSQEGAAEYLWALLIDPLKARAR